MGKKKKKNLNRKSTLTHKLVFTVASAFCLLLSTLKYSRFTRFSLKKRKCSSLSGVLLVAALPLCRGRAAVGGQSSQENGGSAVVRRYVTS